ncbi:hypothetical protein OG196_31980 [Kitasatospora purpeofusca]|nr:hypothetical protein OG196_31980 [Kitasatospora purpeofusca]
MSRDVELGRSVAEIAEMVVADMHMADQTLRGAGLGILPDYAINGGVVLSAVPHDVLSLVEVRQMVNLSATRRLWSRLKNVCAMHPDMVSELWSYKAGRVPGGLFRRLRVPNPIAVFAEPPTVALALGGHGRLLAVVICGRHRAGGVFCLTSDERMDELAIIAICEPLAEDGSPLPSLDGDRPTWEYANLSIPAGDSDRFSAEDLAEWTARRDGLDAPTDGQREIITRILQLLVYLCSSKADITAPVAPRGKAAKRGRRERQWKSRDTFLRVGWRLGPALKAARERAQLARRSTERAGSGPSGWRQYPHQRGGHQKTVWKGPGRTIPDSTLVLPYWVSQDLLADGEAPEGIVRPVR